MKSALGGIVKKVAAGTAAVGIMGVCYADRCAAAGFSAPTINGSTESGPDGDRVTVDKINAVTDFPTLALMYDKYYGPINSDPDLVNATLAKRDGFVKDFERKAHPYSLDGARDSIGMRRLFEMRPSLSARSGETLPSNNEIVSSATRRADRLEKYFGVPADNSGFVNYVLKNTSIEDGVDARALGRRRRRTSDVVPKSVKEIEGLPGLVAFYEENRDEILSNEGLLEKLRGKCGGLVRKFSYYVDNAPTLDDALNLAYAMDSFPKELIPSGVSLPSKCYVMRAGIKNQFAYYAKLGVNTAGYRKVEDFVWKANGNKDSKFYRCVPKKDIIMAGKSFGYGARTAGLKNIMRDKGVRK